MYYIVNLDEFKIHILRHVLNACCFAYKMLMLQKGIGIT